MIIGTAHLGRCDRVVTWAFLWVLIIGVHMVTSVTMDESIDLEPGMSFKHSVTQRPLSPAVVEAPTVCPHSFPQNICLLPGILWA